MSSVRGPFFTARTRPRLALHPQARGEQVLRGIRRSASTTAFRNQPWGGPPTGSVQVEPAAPLEDAPPSGAGLDGGTRCSARRRGWSPEPGRWRWRKRSPFRKVITRVRAVRLGASASLTLADTRIR